MDLKHPDLYWPEHSKENWLSGKFSWNEIGYLLRSLDVYKCSLFVDIEVGKGETIPWIGMKTVYNKDFQYLGISLDNAMLDKIISIPFCNQQNFLLQDGSCHSTAIQSMIKSRVEKHKHPVLLYIGNGDMERSFKTYINIARPGDLICVWGFPVNFHLSVFDDFRRAGKIRRLKEQWKSDRLIAGEIL